MMNTLERDMINTESLLMDLVILQEVSHEFCSSVCKNIFIKKIKIVVVIKKLLILFLETDCK